MPKTQTRVEGEGTRTTRSALDILYRRAFAGRPDRIAELAEARVGAAVSRKVRALRAATGLSQQQLAELVGTQKSAISRLENDDYDGHSMTMLNRIAAALGYRVDLHFRRVADSTSSTGGVGRTRKALATK
jgi:DNA-binding XRE family transcriptional regulator